jgi:hypothetical protein
MTKKKAHKQAALEATQWQPIETAPKDGRVILVYGGIAHWYFNNDGGEWRTLTGEQWPGKRINWLVTHWMPLPAKPEETQTSGPAMEAKR